MAFPSTPENVRAAQERIAASHERAANAPAAELRRLRLGTMIAAGHRFHSKNLSDCKKDIFEHGDFLVKLETFTERALHHAHLEKVYARANEAVQQDRVEEYIASIERQLLHATRAVPNGASAINAMSRAYYIAARAQFLKDCEPAETDRLTSLEAG